MATKFQGSPEEVAALNALIALLRCAEAVSTALHRKLGSAGVTTSQFGILEALLHLECQVKQGEIGSPLTAFESIIVRFGVSPVGA